MNSNELAALHADGYHTTAWGLFAGLCTKLLSTRHAVPSDVSHLVHYTTLDALMSMLGAAGDAAKNYPLATRGPSGVHGERGGSVGHLRLYDTFSSNDPHEGAFFVDSARAQTGLRRAYGALWNLFEHRSAVPAYQTSLTYVRDTAEADNLMFWRTYGKEGTGCALVFPMTCFDGQAVPLFRVRYGGREVDTCLDMLFELLEEYVQIPGAPNLKKMSKFQELPAPLVKALSPLVYLYKSPAYEYEQEVRIVIPFPDLEDGLYLQGSSVTDIPLAWRHFAELSTLRAPELFVSGSHIFLGPTVAKATNVQFVLERLLRARQLYGPKVKQSTISYRR